LALASDLNRPITIHCRGAWGRLLELLDHFSGTLPPVQIHCFGGSAEVAKELLRRGAWLSFSGTLTRPNIRKARDAVRQVPPDRLLLETDAPDLLPLNLPCAPEENLNEPSNLPLILEKASEFRGEPAETVADCTYRNAVDFFRI
jgi:TatD DNase family protein